MSNKVDERSNSQKKRDARRKEVKKQKRSALLGRIAAIVVIVLIVGAIGSAIGWNIYKKVATTVASTDYSACLTDDGLIKDTDVAASLTLVDYENMTVAAADVAATDEEVQSDIDSTLEANKTLSTDAASVIADGDEVNIDYVGTVDGVAFDGGDTQGNGSDVTIGSGSLIDDFEQQLIGHKPGDEVTVNVTFPDDYQSTDLAGKDAEFAVTVNGVYNVPELTDEFVKANLSEDASTADEYRTFVQNKYQKQHLSDYLVTAIDEQSTVSTYPESYVKNMKQTLVNDDEQMMDYYNQMYQQYTGSAMYETVYDMNSESWFNYEKDLTSRAQNAVKSAMVYQAIYEKAGLQFTADEYRTEYDAENSEGAFDSAVSNRGQGYVMQQHISEVVLDYLCETVTVK